MSRPYRGHTLQELLALRDSGLLEPGSVQYERIEQELATRTGVERETSAPEMKREPVRRMKFCLPLPPNPNRETRAQHWSATYRRNERYRAAADALLAYGALPAPPPVPHRRVRIRAKLYVWSRMDKVNAMARIKVAEDWLVTAGYVVDDSEAHVEWTDLPEQAVDRECPRLVLWLTKPKESGA